MIICTKNDKDFYKFKNKVNIRNVKFTIKISCVIIASKQNKPTVNL